MNAQRPAALFDSMQKTSLAHGAKLVISVCTSSLVRAPNAGSHPTLMLSPVHPCYWCCRAGSKRARSRDGAEATEAAAQVTA